MKPSDRVDGRYHVERILGEGGMGKVFLAHDLELDKKVAIKTLLPQAISDLSSLAQLKKEVRLTQDLRHENICGVYHFQPSGAEPFVVMEFIDGDTLPNFIFRQPGHRCDEATFRPLATQILMAVEYAHRTSVIHRDLKTGNIMVKHDGSVRVMDFGIAASLKEAQSRATGSDVTLSIHYASPEQINGESASVSMDIYSLGCVFYEMLTGQPPFRHGDILHQQLTREPEPMTGVSPAINKAVLACLAKDPGKRLHSAAEIREALEGRWPTGPIGYRTIKIPRPARTAVVSFRNWIAVIWALVVLLVALGGALWVRSWRHTMVGPGVNQAVQTVQIPASPPKSSHTPPNDTDQVGQLLASGRGSLQAGAYQEAIQDFNKVLNLDPANRAAIGGKSEAQLALQKTPQRESESADLRAGWWVDPHTGLMWTAKDNNEDLDILHAAAYCTNLRAGGHLGWRLPAVSEFLVLSNRSATWPANSRFPLVLPAGACEWSSDVDLTPYGSKEGPQRWAFSFSAGSGVRAIEQQVCHVFCVRSNF